MKTLIVYAHPYEGSFNHFVLGRVKDLLASAGKETDLIDLNKDGFDPVMHGEDLRLFSKGDYHDRLAADYSARLLSSDELVLIFPVWWYGVPAIMKGFFDKVFLKGRVYDEVDHKLTGLLKIKRATILTTGSLDKAALSSLGDPIGNVLARGTLGLVGIKDVVWIHCPRVHLEETRREFLKEIDGRFAE
jgi:putative NADPH-quinone reductase